MEESKKQPLNKNLANPMNHIQPKNFGKVIQEEEKKEEQDEESSSGEDSSSDEEDSDDSNEELDADNEDPTHQFVAQ